MEKPINYLKKITKNTPIIWGVISSVIAINANDFSFTAEGIVSYFTRFIHFYFPVAFIWFLVSLIYIFCDEFYDYSFLQVIIYFILFVFFYILLT